MPETTPDRPDQPQPTAADAAPGGRTAPRRVRAPRGPAAPPPAPAIPEWSPPPDYLIIGRVAGAHGLRGEFRMVVITNHPGHLRTLRTVYLGDERAPFRVSRMQASAGGKEAIVKLAGIGGPEAVAERRGQLVWIARADAPPLPEGEYYHYQLLGIEVVDEAGAMLGRLAEIIETGANDVYVVRGPAGELLLPVIDGVILSVDPEAGRLVARPPEYL